MMYLYRCIMLMILVTLHILVETQATKNVNFKTFSDGSVIPSFGKMLKRFKRNQPPFMAGEFILKANQTNRLSVLDATNFVCGKRSFCDDTFWTGKGICSFDCLPQCSCDKQCHLFGDCCPDRTFQNSSDLPSISSPYVSCLAKNWTAWSNYSSVLMIDSCPEGSSFSENVTKKCQEPDNAFLDQATPVITIDEKITYRNKFCAECHEKTVYEGWRHEVICVDGTKLTAAKSKDELWRLIIASPENCHIQTNPPDGFAARICEGIVLNKCNETGSWEEYDPKVEELCNLYNHKVQYYMTANSVKSYKNIFCAVCNGVKLVNYGECNRGKDPEIPYALSVLLDFNPVSRKPTQDSTIKREFKQTEGCQTGQVFDPFKATCQPIICPQKRVLDGDSCRLFYSASTGLGVRFSALIKPANDSLEQLPYMVGKGYNDVLRAALDEFKPFIIYKLNMTYFSRLQEPIPIPDNTLIEKPLSHFFNISQNRLVISGEIISLSRRSVVDLESTMLSFLSANWTYFDGMENVSLSSTPRFCESSDQLEGYFVTLYHQDEFESFVNLHHICNIIDCKNTTAIYSLTLDCPFFEYNMSATQNFTYNSTESSVSFENLTIFLNDSDVLFCGETLRLCLKAVANIGETIIENQDKNNNGQSRRSGSQMNFTMAMVSLVCITLSLIGLMLTFIIYSIIPKLRSVPGLNTMALIFYLFCAQLIFLVGSNNSENKTVCKVLAVCIHFFWIATFSWMGVSAYHMHSVFTNLRPMTNVTKENHARHYRYWAMCFAVSVLVVSASILYSLVRSDWDEIGYGGKICFINDPIVIGIFFAGPLSLVLLINLTFFLLTVFAIRRVPNMSESSNKANKHHLFVYIKLSLLFGFSWIFGILAATFSSDVLWYIFIVLAGTQGLLLFVAYCVNKRTMDMLKTAYKEHHGDKGITRSNIGAQYRKSNTTLTTSHSKTTSSNKTPETSGENPTTSNA